MEKELFEKMGELHLATAKIDYHKEQLDLAYQQADKFGTEYLALQQKYFKKYNRLPNFF
jgi:hypothetical protein